MTAPIDLTTDYFNVWDIIQFEIVGGEYLTVILLAILLAFLIAKYAVPFHTGIGIMLIYFLIASIITSNWSIYVMAQFLIGLFAFILFSKMFQR